MDGIIGCPFFVALLPIGIYNSTTIGRVLERSAGAKIRNSVPPKRFKVLKPQTKIRMSANTKISLRSVKTHTVNNEPACLHKRTGRRLLDCIYGSFNEFRDVLHPHCPPSLSNLRHRSAHVHKLKLVDPTFPLQHCHIAKYFTAFWTWAPSEMGWSLRKRNYSIVRRW